MKSTTRALSFLVLSLLVTIAVTKAEEDCSPDGKSYGAKEVACNYKKNLCTESEVFVTTGGAGHCIPNKQITMVYAATIGCTELLNVTGTKKICIDWYNPAINDYVEQVCYDYNDCVATPDPFSWSGFYCTAAPALKEGKFRAKCTADCRDTGGSTNPE